VRPIKINWFRRQQREAELDAEIRSHLDEAIRDRSAAFRNSPFLETIPQRKFQRTIRARADAY
jgi:hypothetical protein